jgi:hypothetical protein
VFKRIGSNEHPSPVINRQQGETNEAGILVDAILRAIPIVFFLCAGAVAAPGEIDATFGQHGRVVLDVPGAAYAFATNFIQQSDGKVVAVGFAQTTSSSAGDFLVVRFNVDGALDAGPTGFNGTGYRREDIGGFTDVAFSVVQQGDGKLLVAEGDEVFNIALSGATGGATIGTSMATVTISEDDPQPAPPRSGGGGRLDRERLLLLAGLLAIRFWTVKLRRRIPQ